MMHKSTFLLAMVFFVLIGHAQDKPKMYYTDTSSGKPIAKDPTVVYFKNAYWMYYSIANNDKKGWSIGIAKSNDLTNWQKTGEINPEETYEKNGLCAPGAYVENGKINLFYQTYGNGPKDAICHATSTDGIHFKRNKTNPVFRSTGKWNNGRAIDAEVIKFKGKYFLYFATRDPEGKIQMQGVATAPGNSNFNRDAWTMAADKSILYPTLAWERNCVEGASLVNLGDELYMFYAGSYNNEPQQIGIAKSKDGITWQRLYNHPFLENGKQGTWNNSESGHPDIFKDNEGNYHLFFQGNNTGDGNTWYLSKKEIIWKDGFPVLLN
ncbi:family 43 glycosylhydrolase [Galbibacter pacificus]|uniref:Family 43 glycosylhydrolase n=1 Tax=Galbibacter pacificus TaxID=2996052 RepID=A0ABT6FPS4_9FLAO|nr:family 43 glycosylhydrolase [Galbibacter pacificus]MDG3582253.1 family 43 glycosylhydrolase [Galbibacter pacificus]MDG3585271.1 family 43 glycosylhydrolase [Galbibacter pacificus]